MLESIGVRGLRQEECTFMLGGCETTLVVAADPHCGLVNTQFIIVRTKKARDCPAVSSCSQCSQTRHFYPAKQTPKLAVWRTTFYCLWFRVCFRVQPMASVLLEAGCLGRWKHWFRFDRFDGVPYGCIKSRSPLSLVETTFHLLLLQFLVLGRQRWLDLMMIHRLNSSDLVIRACHG